MQSESQSNRAPGPRGACREAPPAGWNGAGFLPDGAEGNPASRRSRALHNQNVSPFQLRLRAQQDLAPRIDIMIHVANVLSNKATNHWAIGPLGHWAIGPSICQVGCGDETAVQGHDHIQSPAPVLAGDFLAQGRERRCARQNPLPLTARSKLFLSDHNPRAGLFIRSKIGGHRKAAGPNESFTTRQHRPAVPLPSADVLCVQ